MLTAVSARCPYCGEPVEIVIDPAEGDHTRTEDCSVCCAPMAIRVRLGPNGDIDLTVAREDD